MNQYYAYNIIKQLYYPELNFNTNEEIEILNRYASPEQNIGKPIEFPDRISNINGTHNYKLISAKDINFNNVLLPNSVVSENNWGNFDETRRWPSGSPIYINDVYELMNVVDYLLCATEDLWSEINNLKYGSDIIATLWFINDLNGPINNNNSTNANSAQFMSKNSNYAILLNPKTYFTTLPSPILDYFGIGTQFFEENHDDYPILRRIIQPNTNNRNGIQAFISYKDHNNYVKTQNDNVDGRIVPIYGYKIGQDLHFYPMFKIDNFFKSALDDFNNYDSLIDFNKMKLKYDVYFRINNGSTISSRFERVYIDFLYSDWENVGRPYILYFISEGKRQIIYIHTEEGGKTIEDISRDLKNYTEYVNNFYNIDENKSFINIFGSELDVFSMNNGLEYPYLYHISDSSKIGLFVQTPNSPNFSLIHNTLDIQYFKNNNELSANIILPGNKIVSPIEDKEQESGILYSPIRYNIPDNTNVNISISGNYLNNNNNIKLDDEYTDILIPINAENKFVTNDVDAQKYYYYNGLDNNGKRIFVNFNSATELNNFFNTENSNAVNINNIDGVKSAHVYIKNTEAYQLKYKLITNSLINQIADYNDVVEQTRIIENNKISLENNEYTYILSINNYNLPGQLEQIKFDLNLYVEETSKVQSTNLNLPISINKIHQPCIQFISKDLMQKEIEEYDNYYTYTFGDRSGGGIANYKYTNNTTTPNPFSINSEGNSKTNQNISQDINDENDQFNTFTELYNYIIERKYNNFEKTEWNGNIKRSDILANIYNGNINFSNDANIEATFNKSFTYDNSGDNMRELIITYHPTYTMLNLIGGGVFENYLKSNSTQGNNMVDKQAITYFDSITYTPEQGKTTYLNFNSIFNINGLGFNYRLHGGDSYLYINKEAGLGHSTIDLPFNNQYDLLCNPCINNESNIIKYMEISLTDNNNQIPNISRLGSQMENNSELFIENNILDIKATTYQSIVQKDFHRLSNWTKNVNANNQLSLIKQFTSTYNTPIIYLDIKDTTFYPTSNILPEENEYDLNDPEDIIKYSQYIEYWNSNTQTNGNVEEISKYKPITISLQLHENLYNNTPFFYESNVAKLKFNIIRVDPSTINGFGQSIYGIESLAVELAINQRYYLSYFIPISAPTTILNTIGSYPKYNENTGKFDIKEIISNTINTGKYPPSIFKSNNKYQYDIEKCAKLNKIHFNLASIADIPISTPIIDKDTLYWFDTNIDNIINLLNTNSININPLFADSGEGLKLSFSNGNIYGNKKYLNITRQAPPEINFKFIHRTKPSSRNIDDPVLIYINENTTINTSHTDDGTFKFTIDNIEHTFKHYEFYSLGQILSGQDSVELFEIPPVNSISNIYIYRRSDYSMICLNDYDEFRSGITNADKYTIYYNTILDAFQNNKIFYKIN